MIVIFSYNRPEMLLNLLKELEGEKPTVIDDGSKYDFSEHEKLCNYLRVDHVGKKGYWTNWNIALAMCDMSDNDFFLFMPDDISDVDIKAIRRLGQSLKDEFYAFNYLNDGRDSCWGKGVVSPEKIDGIDCKKINFVDCGFFTNRKTLSKIGFQINQISKERFKDPLKSSGVGQQLTERLRKIGAKMYKPDISLAYHGNHTSEMNPVERKKNPLVTNSNKIWVNLATIPSREKQLEKTISSLYDQCERIVVMLNGHKKEPGFLIDDKIKTILRNNERGCSEKLYDVKNQNGLILTCDDDLIYPSDYVQKITEAQKKIGGIVTYHGSILKLPSRNYYFDRRVVYQCLRNVRMNKRVDIPGTGVMCYDSAKFRFEYDRVEHRNMSDIWVGVFAREQNVPITVLEHKEGWITDQKVEDDIYHRYVQNCSIQTALVNKHFSVSKADKPYHGFKQDIYKRYQHGLKRNKVDG